MLSRLGQTGLHALFPNDFEVYIIAFELVDSNDFTLELFSLPIMPSNISISEPEITNIKKTNKGVVSLKSDSFVPKDINLSGNFGRNLKMLVRSKIVDFNSFKGGLGTTTIDFQGSIIKTGYGTTKVFQNILNGSKALDQFGKPVKLYFYNFAFNENYVVEVVDKTFTQSKDASNLIWNYNVSLKAVATINNSLKSIKSLAIILAKNTLHKAMNTLASDIKKSLPTKVKNASIGGISVL